MLSDFFTSDVIVLVIVNALIFVASEFCLPYVFKGVELGNRQRHFYSILLTVFSLTMSFTITTVYEIRQKITSVENGFTPMVDSDMKQHFQDIFASYHKHFRQPGYSPMLEPWVNHAIETLSEDMKQVSVSLPPSDALHKVLDIYNLANDHIVATHVGSIERFLKNEIYRKANLTAFNRGIPVVRFYLFDSEQSTAGNLRCVKSSVESNVSCSNLDVFNDEVRDLHDQMKTLMSVVIPPDRLHPRVSRDILLADGNFLVETMFDDGTVSATGEAKALGDARSFLTKLMGKTIPRKYVHVLRKEEVLKHFGRYSQHLQPQAEPLAKTLARHLIEDIGM